jgi:hypothetical protein
MSETPINPPDETSSGRRIEIIHYPSSDVIINNDAGYAAYGRRLAELFKEGVPADWEQFIADDKDMAHGQVDGVEFFVKPKTWPGIIKYEQQKEARIPFGRTEQERRIILRSIQLNNGVLSEIGLAPAIKRAAASQSAQELANSWGFKSFGLAEPVIGVIYKPSGLKSVVYEYIDGVKTLKDESVKTKYVISLKKRDEMIAALEQLFERQGIQADDLSEKNLLVDPQDNLHLIDTELYQRLPPGH